MPPKKIKTEENTVRQGRKNFNCYWINMKAYQMLFNSVLIFSAGGKENLEETELIKSFILKNKLSYHNCIKVAQIEYNEVLKSGKYQGKSVDEVLVLERKYLEWMRDNYNFGAQEKLKNEIINSLK